MTLNIQFRPGRLPNDPTARRIRLAAHLRAAAPPPATVDWHSRVTTWPMYGNDAYGDCVWAEIGHEIESHTAYGLGKPVLVGEIDVLKGYSDVTGFDPDDPSTDQGTVIQDAMGYWRKTGIGGHRIAAFAEVDVHNLVEVRTALALFGGLSIGVNFPASAMDQFNAGQPWDVVRHDGGIEGGHCVQLVGYDETWWYVVTWGAVQRVTPAWWARYVEEAWLPVLATEWVSPASGVDPVGETLASLGEEFAALTGEANPFPAPSPAPQPPGPAPAPPPAPAPVADDADWTLAQAFADWARTKGIGAPSDAETPGEALADAVAEEFHEAYERLAPAHGYETRRESAVRWSQVPERNRALMRAVVVELFERGVIVAGMGVEVPVTGLG